MKKLPKIFEIGHGKMGSSSLWRAMEHIGYDKAAHWHSLEHSKDYVDKIKQNKFDFDFVRDNRYVGNTTHTFFREHAELYPNAKFILLNRNEEDWIRSYRSWLAGTHGGGQKDCFYLYMMTAYGRSTFDERAWRRSYAAHYSSVIQYFSNMQDRLLILNVTEGEGYEKIIPFIGNPNDLSEREISEMAFPHANKRPDG